MSDVRIKREITIGHHDFGASKNLLRLRVLSNTMQVSTTIGQDKSSKKASSKPLVVVKSSSDACKISRETRRNFLLVKVLEYFLDPIEGHNRLSIMYDFLKKKGTSPNALSLRVLEYAVIHYGEVNPTAAVITIPTKRFESNRPTDQSPIDVQSDQSSQSAQVSVFDHYKQQLNSFTKRQFDPCARGGREHFGLPLKVSNENGSVEEVIIVTNLRQANFFKWAIEYGVVSYVKKNLDDIRSKMAEKAKFVTSNGKSKKRKREGSMKEVFTYTWAPSFERIGEPEPKIQKVSM